MVQVTNPDRDAGVTELSECAGPSAARVRCPPGCFSARTISVFMRDNATALPCQRRPWLSGMSGSMARREHSIEP
jgi:hypothetical protein